MAIRDKNQAPQQTVDNFSKQQQSQQTQQLRQETGPIFEKRSPISNFIQGGVFGAPIAPAIGSEIYKQLKDGLAKIYKTVDEGYEIALIDLDRASYPNLNYGAIVVAGRIKDAPQLGVAFHILLIEGTGEELQVKTVNTGQGNVELFQTASDAVNERLITLAAGRVEKVFPNQKVYHADSTVIPRAFDAEDEVVVYQVALNSIMATSTLLETLAKDWTDLNLTELPRDLGMEIDVAFGRNQRQNILGGPMRSDATINFLTRKNQNRNDYELNVGGGSEKRSVVSSFVDLLWDPTDPMGYNSFYHNPNMMQPTQKYVARCVITDLDSLFGYTPASVLLALSTTIALSDRNNWYQLFTPHKTDSRVDLADIGALNIEANLSNDPSGIGPMIDTKSSDFGLDALGNFLNSTVKQGLIFSLDCPESGPQSWYLDVFVKAAQGSSAAYNVIYEAAKELTNGAFGTYFQKGEQMFIDMENRIHLGTWRDSTGEKRDIRDIDYLAVMNLMGETDPKAFRDWSDTFLRKDIPQARRLAGRRRMLMALTNDSAEFTGFAERLTFSHNFIQALGAGIKATNLPITINTPLSAQDWNNQRGTAASFSQAALVAPGVHTFAMPSVATQNYGTGAHFNGYRPY